MIEVEFKVFKGSGGGAQRALRTMSHALALPAPLQVCVSQEGGCPVEQVRASLQSPERQGLETRMSPGECHEYRTCFVFRAAPFCLLGKEWWV